MRAIIVVPVVFGFIAMSILWSAMGIGALTAAFLFGVVQWACRIVYNAMTELED